MFIINNQLIAEYVTSLPSKINNKVKKEENMKKYIKALEQLGQTSSIQQYQNLDEMINDRRLDHAEVDKMFSQSSELYCFHAPGDDDDDE